MEFCNLKAQYAEYQVEIDAAISKVLKESRYINGPEVSELESALTAFVGSQAIACANGTDALQLALMALDIGPGDEVITTPFTFIATAEMIALVGATPVFVDIKEDDFNMNPELIEAKITSNTKAIIAVSLYGQVSDMDEINVIAEKHNLTVIEDAAQSFGATYKGNRSCNLSRIATTSFFPAKPLGCYGDGGAVFTNDKELEEKVRCLRNHGQVKRYHHGLVGINSRLDTLQAAVLIVKLKYYEKEITQRQTNAAYYSELLNTKVQTPGVMEDKASVWAQYTIRVENRDQIQSALSEANIPSAVHYPMPLHLQECFANLGGKKGDFPIAEKVSRQVMSLPMSAHLTEDEQDLVAQTLKGQP